MYIHNLAHYRQMVFMILRYADNALLTMGTPVYKIRDALGHRKVASSFDYLNLYYNMSYRSVNLLKAQIDLKHDINLTV